MIQITDRDTLRFAVARARQAPELRWYVTRRARALDLIDEVPEAWLEVPGGSIALPASQANGEAPEAPEEVSEAGPTPVAAAFKGGGSTAAREEASKSGVALPGGSFPIKDKADVKRAVRALGRAKDKAAAKRHIIKRARALGATDLLPEDWLPKRKAKTASVTTTPVPRPSAARTTLTAANLGRRAVGAVGGWDGSMHPRGRDGQFIESGGSVNLYDAPGARKPSMRGTSVGLKKGADGKPVISVKADAPGTFKGKDVAEGDIVEVTPADIAAAPKAKGRIDRGKGAGYGKNIESPAQKRLREQGETTMVEAPPEEGDPRSGWQVGIVGPGGAPVTDPDELQRAAQALGITIDEDQGGGVALATVGDDDLASLQNGDPVEREAGGYGLAIDPGEVGGFDEEEEGGEWEEPAPLPAPENPERIQELKQITKDQSRSPDERAAAFREWADTDTSLTPGQQNYLRIEAGKLAPEAPEGRPETPGGSEWSNYAQALREEALDYNDVNIEEGDEDTQLTAQISILDDAVASGDENRIKSASQHLRDMLLISYADEEDLPPEPGRPRPAPGYTPPPGGAPDPWATYGGNLIDEAESYNQMNIDEGDEDTDLTAQIGHVRDAIASGDQAKIQSTADHLRGMLAISYADDSELPTRPVIRSGPSGPESRAALGPRGLQDSSTGRILAEGDIVEDELGEQFLLTDEGILSMDEVGPDGVAAPGASLGSYADATSGGGPTLRKVDTFDNRFGAAFEPESEAPSAAPDIVPATDRMDMQGEVRAIRDDLARGGMDDLDIQPVEDALVGGRRDELIKALDDVIADAESRLGNMGDAGGWGDEELQALDDNIYRLREFHEQLGGGGAPEAPGAPNAPEAAAPEFRDVSEMSADELLEEAAKIGEGLGLDVTKIREGLVPKVEEEEVVPTPEAEEAPEIKGQFERGPGRNPDNLPYRPDTPDEKWRTSDDLKPGDRFKHDGKTWIMGDGGVATSGTETSRPRAGFFELETGEAGNAAERSAQFRAQARSLRDRGLGDQADALERKADALDKMRGVGVAKPGSRNFAMRNKSGGILTGAAASKALDEMRAELGPDAEGLDDNGLAALAPDGGYKTKSGATIYKPGEQVPVDEARRDRLVTRLTEVEGRGTKASKVEAGRIRRELREMGLKGDGTPMSDDQAKIDALKDAGELTGELRDDNDLKKRLVDKVTELEGGGGGIETPGPGGGGTRDSARINADIDTVTEQINNLERHYNQQVTDIQTNTRNGRMSLLESKRAQDEAASSYKALRENLESQRKKLTDERRALMRAGVEEQEGGGGVTPTPGGGEDLTTLNRDTLTSRLEQTDGMIRALQGQRRGGLKDPNLENLIAERDRLSAEMIRRLTEIDRRLDEIGGGAGTPGGGGGPGPAPTPAKLSTVGINTLRDALEKIGGHPRDLIDDDGTVRDPDAMIKALEDTDRKMKPGNMFRFDVTSALKSLKKQQKAAGGGGGGTPKARDIRAERKALADAEKAETQTYMDKVRALQAARDANEVSAADYMSQRDALRTEQQAQTSEFYQRRSALAQEHREQSPTLVTPGNLGSGGPYKVRKSGETEAGGGGEIFDVLDSSGRPVGRMVKTDYISHPSYGEAGRQRAGVRVKGWAPELDPTTVMELTEGLSNEDAKKVRDRLRAFRQGRSTSPARTQTQGIEDMVRFVDQVRTWRDSRVAPGGGGEGGGKPLPWNKGR